MTENDLTDRYTMGFVYGWGVGSVMVIAVLATINVSGVWDAIHATIILLILYILTYIAIKMSDKEVSEQ